MSDQHALPDLSRWYRLRAAVTWGEMSQDDRSMIASSGVLALAGAAVTSLVGFLGRLEYGSYRTATVACGAAALAFTGPAIARVARRYRHESGCMHCTAGCGAIWTAPNEPEAFQRWGRLDATGELRAFIPCRGVDGQSEHHAPISRDVALGTMRDTLAVYARDAGARAGGEDGNASFSRRATALLTYGTRDLSGVGPLDDIYDERRLYTSHHGVPWPGDDREALYRLLGALALDSVGYQGRTSDVYNYTYHVNGPNARVNHGSTDASTNVSTAGEDRPA